MLNVLYKIRNISRENKRENLTKLAVIDTVHDGKNQSNVLQLLQTILTMIILLDLAQFSIILQHNTSTV